MKKSFVLSTLLLAFSSVPVLAQQDAQAQQGMNQIGRYQLAEIVTENGPEQMNKPTRMTVLIDTVTGNTSICGYHYRDAGKGKDGKDYWAVRRSCDVAFNWGTEWFIPKKSEKH